MSRSAREQLAEDGVTAPFPSFMDPRTLQELREYLSGVIENHVKHPLYGRYSVRDWHLVSDLMRQTMTAPEIADSLADATGARSLMLWRTKLFEKVPGDGPIDWHQEYGYFDGEEIGGHRPALIPLGRSNPWTWTIWLPLTDVTEDDGVMEFVRGSHLVRYPTRMVDLVNSGAFVDPRNRVGTREEFLELAANDSLVLDVETASMLRDVDYETYSLEQLFDLLDSHIRTLQAVTTEPFDIPTGANFTTPMSAGSYVIFNQRCMHRSRGSLPSANFRLAISARYTVGSTWVYPYRVQDDSMDGSGLDIIGHRCVPLYGSDFNIANSYV